MTEKECNTDQAQGLSNVLAVVEYLTAKGFRIKKSSAYQHVREKTLQRQADGTFSVADVEKYAYRCLKRLDGASTRKSYENMQERKCRADVEAAEYEARIKKKKAEAIEGKFILRDVFEDELSTQALAFRNALHTFVHTNAEEIVHFVSGDTSRVPDLISFVIERFDAHILKTAEDLEARGPMTRADLVDGLELFDNDKDESQDDDHGAE